jgi:hypothetical protein
LGEDSEAGSPGFVLLHEAPFGAPTPIEPNRSPMKSKYVQALTGKAMQEVLESHLEDEDTAVKSMDWLKQCATTGKIPYTLVDEDADQNLDTRAQWGPQIKVGVPGRQGDFSLVEHDAKFSTNATFWELPVEAAAVLEAQANELRMAQSELLQMPNVRYLSTRKRKRDNPKTSKEFSAANIRARNEIGDKEFIDGPILDEKDCEVERVDDITSDEDESQPSWGADIKGCKKDHYAIVATEFSDAHGIQILQISEIVSGEESQQTFKGVELTLDSSTLTQSDKECLKGNWYLTGKEVPKIQKVWWVLAYCSKLKKAGRKTWKLPTPVVTKIQKLIMDQKLPLFQSKSDEQTENVDRNRRGYDNHGGGDSEEDHYEETTGS